MNIGDIILSEYSIRTAFIPFSAKNLTLNRYNTDYNIIIYFYDVDEVCLASSFLMNKNQFYSTYPQVLNVPPPTKFIKLSITRVDNGIIDLSAITGKEFKIESGTIGTDWTPAPEDTQAAIDEAKNKALELEYLKTALAGSTEIAGGLILANMLLLKDQSNNVTAGMSGLTTNDLFLFAHSADALNMALNNKSTFLLRRDGTGNMGNFEITKTGVFFKERGADGRLGKTVVEFRSSPIPPLSDLVSSFTTSVSYAGGSATKMGGVRNGDFGYSSLITVTAYDNFSLRVEGYLSILLMNDISTPISQTEVNIALVLYEYSGGQYINGTVMSSLGRYSIEPNLINEDYNVDFTLTLPKGSYALRAEYHISARAGTNDYATAEASSVVLTASGAAANKCLIFGSDGFVRVKDGNNYTYISDNTIAFKGLPSSAGGTGTGIVYSDNGTLKLS